MSEDSCCGHTRDDIPRRDVAMEAACRHGLLQGAHEPNSRPRQAERGRDGPQDVGEYSRQVSPAGGQDQRDPQQEWRP